MLHSSAAQKRWTLHKDAAGNCVWRASCRAAGLAFRLLSAADSFSPRWLVADVNASGNTPLDEAVVAGQRDVRQVLAERYRSWKLKEELQRALLKAAKMGALNGIEMLLAMSAVDEFLLACAKQVISTLGSGDFLREAETLIALLQPPHRRGPAEPEALAHGSLTSIVAPRSVAPGLTIAPVQASEAAALAELVRRAPGASKRDAALGALESYLSSQQGSQESCQARSRAAWAAIDAVERHAFGLNFGKHFAAHRPRMQDAQLLRRLHKFGRYSASRFGVDSAPAILRLRRRALQLATQARSTLCPGRYVLQLRDVGVHGSGFVAEGDDGTPRRFERSDLVRVVVALTAEVGGVDLISMYPVPDRRPAQSAEEELMAVNEM